MSRKAIAFLLVAVMVALAACAPAAPAPTAAPAAPTAAPAAPTAAPAAPTAAPAVATPAAATPVAPPTSNYPVVKDPITVTGIRHIAQDRDNKEPRYTWERLEQVTGIHVDIQYLPDEAQLPVFLAAGNWPDFFHDNLKANFINEYGVLGGKFVDYNTLADVMPNLQQVYELYPDARKAYTQTNGSIYQLFTLVLSVTGAQSRLYYRTDILKDNGLEVPTTTDEFIDVCKKLYAATGNSPLAGNFYKDFFYSAFGPGVRIDGRNEFDDIKNDGTVTYGRVTDQYKEYLKFLNTLYSEKILHPEFLTMDSATVQALTDEGKFVFASGSLQNIKIASFPSGKWDLNVLAPLTSPVDGERVIFSGTPPWGTAKGFAINKDSKYVKEIARMMDVAFALEEVVPGSNLNGDAFTWGPQNDCWKYTNAEKTEHAMYMPKDNPKLKDLPWDSANQYGLLIYDNIGISKAFEKSIVMDGSNSQARQVGFRDNSIPYARKWFWPSVVLNNAEQEVIDQYSVELNTYVDEMYAQFVTGVVGIDAGWDSYLATLDKMGYTEVLKQYQSAYDRYRSL